jgi:N utilization substance protein B
MAARGRHSARRLLVQALYQMQLTGHDIGELTRQFHDDPRFATADEEYFDELLVAICAEPARLDVQISEYGYIPSEQIDPVERAVMWLALTELQHSADVPVKVIINEAIELTKLFGAEGGYRYVNSLLDKAAAELR